MLHNDQWKAIESDFSLALDQCNIQYGISVNETRELLTNIPAVLFLRDVEANELLDLDARASLLRTSQSKWDEIESVQWEQLDGKERRAAQKIAAFLDSDRLFPRQRPAEIDTRLALYLIFRFEELLGRKLPFSRPPGGGPPQGPAFRALLAALTLAQARVEPNLTEHPKPNQAGLASILEITRTDEFEHLLRQQGFHRTSNDVLSHGHSIGLTVALARKKIIDARGTGGKSVVPTN